MKLGKEPVWNLLGYMAYETAGKVSRISDASVFWLPYILYLMDLAMLMGFRSVLVIEIQVVTGATGKNIGRASPKCKMHMFLSDGIQELTALGVYAISVCLDEAVRAHELAVPKASMKEPHQHPHQPQHARRQRTPTSIQLRQPLPLTSA